MYCPIYSTMCQCRALPDEQDDQVCAVVSTLQSHVTALERPAEFMKVENVLVGRYKSFLVTIRDTGIQTDKEIQNPVSEPKIAAHTPIRFAV